MKTINLDFISDSGHGWLAVPEKLYKESGISASRFSYYSEKTRTVYLEEDCDAEMFLCKMQEKGIAVTNSEKYIDGQCFVRNLGRMPGI